MINKHYIVETFSPSVVKTNESGKTVLDSKILLDYIPDSNYPVIITGYNQVKFNNLIVNTTDYLVDYNNGQITFHSSKEGSNITVASYYAKGVIKYYGDRIVLQDKNNLYESDNIEDFATEAMTRVNNIINNNPQPSEVVDARYSASDGITYPTLSDRLSAEDNKIGVLSNLNTSDKSNIVNAINSNLADKAKQEIDLLDYKNEFTHDATENCDDITAALQHALNDTCPWGSGYNYGVQGKTVRIPAGTYVISSCIVPKSGFSLKGCGLGTLIISKVANESKTFDVSLIANWEMSDIRLQGNNSLNYCIWAPDGAQTVRYKLTNIFARKFKEGFSISGYMGSMINCRGNDNYIGCRLSGAHSTTVHASAFENNDHTGFILEGGTGVLINGCTIEGNGVNECVINGGTNVALKTVYFENSPNDTIEYSLKVGTGTERVYNLEIINCPFLGGAAIYGAAIFDKVTNLSIKNLYSYNWYRGFTFTQNCYNVAYDACYVEKAHIYDDLNVIQTQNPVNLLPNFNFQNWADTTLPASWLPVYSEGDGRINAYISKETTNVKSGTSALKLTSRDGFNYIRREFFVPKKVVDRLKGKAVTLGCWVFIPDISDFGDYITIKDGPTINLSGTGVTGINIERLTTGSDNNYYKKGKWNFIQQTYSLANTVTAEVDGGVTLALYVSQGATAAASTKYVIFDSVFMCEGLYLASAIAQSAIPSNTPEFSEDVKVDNHAWNNNRFILGSYYMWVDSSGKLRIKNGEPVSDLDGTIIGTQS